MTEHTHKHSTTRHSVHSRRKSQLHKDWRVWVVVVLMLAAMATYIVSFDESLWPGGSEDEPPVPAAEL